jgi:hypothetical protein
MCMPSLKLWAEATWYRVQPTQPAAQRPPLPLPEQRETRTLEQPEQSGQPERQTALR